MSLGKRSEQDDLNFQSPASDVNHGDAAGLHRELIKRMGPGTRAFAVIKRVVVGTYNDGMIHAGNLAYLAMLAIFPFFILGSALFTLAGEEADRTAIIETILIGMPPTVQSVLAPAASDAINARQGWLLWVGALIALWTVTGLVETIRDILRRAYCTEAVSAFWKDRLFSAGLIVASVMLLFISLYAQVALSTAEAVIESSFPQFAGAVSELRLSRLGPALIVFASLFMLFITLTPVEYRGRCYPKWPGAVLTTLWWAAVTAAMPPILRSFFTYSLTYGSLAGIMVALFFFFLVGLGMVAGAELNAALAVTSKHKTACEGEVE